MIQRLIFFYFMLQRGIHLFIKSDEEYTACRVCEGIWTHMRAHTCTQIKGGLSGVNIASCASQQYFRNGYVIYSDRSPGGNIWSHKTASSLVSMPLWVCVYVCAGVCVWVSWVTLLSAMSRWHLKAISMGRIHSGTGRSIQTLGLP